MLSSQTKCLSMPVFSPENDGTVLTCSSSVWFSYYAQHAWFFRAVSWPEITKLSFHSWSRCIFLSHEKYEIILWFLWRGYLGSLGGNMGSLSSSCKFHRFLGISMSNYSLPTRVEIKICLLKRVPTLLVFGFVCLFFFQNWSLGWKNWSFYPRSNTLNFSC